MKRQHNIMKQEYGKSKWHGKYFFRLHPYPVISRSLLRGYT